MLLTFCSSVSFTATANWIRELLLLLLTLWWPLSLIVLYRPSSFWKGSRTMLAPNNRMTYDACIIMHGLAGNMFDLLSACLRASSSQIPPERESSLVGVRQAQVCRGVS